MDVKFSHFSFPVNVIGSFSMSTLTFDTLKFARRLKDAGVPDKQAEAEAEALAEVFELHSDELVTREYLDTKFERELAPVHSDLRLMKWMLALIIVVNVAPALKTFFS